MDLLLGRIEALGRLGVFHAQVGVLLNALGELLRVGC